MLARPDPPRCGRQEAPVGRHDVVRAVAGDGVADLAGAIRDRAAENAYASWMLVRPNARRTKLRAAAPVGMVRASVSSATEGTHFA